MSLFLTVNKDEYIGHCKRIAYLYFTYELYASVWWKHAMSRKNARTATVKLSKLKSVQAQHGHSIHCSRHSLTVDAARCIPSTQVPRNSLREMSLLTSHMIAHFCTDLFLNTHARKSQLISRTFPLIVVAFGRSLVYQVT